MKALLIIAALTLPAITRGAEPEVTNSIDAWKFALVDSKGSAVQELVDGKLQPVKRDTLDQCVTAGEIAFRKLGIETDKFACAPRYVVTYTATCPAAPPGPPAAIIGERDGDGFKIVGELIAGACNDDTRWSTKVVGWRKVPLGDGCWLPVEHVLEDCDGKVASAPIDDSPEELDTTPGPMIAGLDFPADEPCPAAAAGNCYFPPTVATRPCPAQGCYRDQVKP